MVISIVVLVYQRVFTIMSHHDYAQMMYHRVLETP